MRDLVIIGSSGFGKEVCWLARRLNINVRCFLDDASEKQGQEVLGVPVSGGILDYGEYLDCSFVVAIGSPRVRKSIVERLHGHVKFATLIDPDAIFEKDMAGAGSIICAGVIATVEIKVGEHSIINLNTTIGHECRIGDFVTIAPNVSISGNINIGDLVEIGTGAALLQEISLGHGSVLGMGGVLVKNLGPNKVAVGNPARIIKSIDE